MLLKTHFVTLFALAIHEAHSLSLGHFPISITTTSLTDHSRLDPFAPSSQPRALVISTFHPTSPNCTTTHHTPYMPPATALFESAKFSTAYDLPDSIFTNLTLTTSSPSCRRAPADPSLPTLLFSPALGTSRHLYTLLAATLATRANVVVTTIDHPYDADIVEFPNGTLVYGLDLADAQIPLAVATRARDMRFVLDWLNRNASARTAPALALGHSLGGAAALAAAAGDARVRGAVNLDGSVFGDVVDGNSSVGVKQPVLFMAHEGKNLSTDATWEAVWPKLRGWKELVGVEGAAHYTFSDLPVLAVGLGLGSAGLEELEGILGTIEGGRAVEVVTRVLGGFVRLVVGGLGEDGFGEVVQGYDEVSVVE